jgi:FHA domain
MPTCPAGHDSTDADFCDVCGMRIGGPAPASGPVPAPDAAPAAPDAGPEACPQCGTARSGQFCEGCGHDFASGKTPGAPMPGAGTAPADGAAPPAAAWTAVVTADRAYFDRVIAEGGPDAAAIEFPGYCPERRFRLSGPEMRIGRRSVSRGLEPEIDLTGPPTDPGVSHLHAVLMAEPDGGWAVLDPGSANGTLVNGGEIAAGVRVPLHDGDRVCVGAWTVLTIRSDSGP